MDARDRTRAVPIAEAARILGKTPDAVRGLIRRGNLTAIRGNDGQRRVLLPEGLATVATAERPSGRDRSPPTSMTAATVATGRDELLTRLLAELRDMLLRTRDERDQARAEAAELRSELMGLKVELATAKAEREAARAVAIADVATAQADAAAKDQVAAELRAQLAREIGRGDALAAALAEARKPWWRRLIG